MSLLRTSAILFVFASGLAWAQSQSVSGPNNDASNTTASVISTVPDSTKLELLKMKKAGYPPNAARDGIQGEVMVEMHISETGDVESVDVLSGESILAEAAVKAAKKWKFKPFIKDGKPIKVVTKVPFDFYFHDKAKDQAIPVGEIRYANGVTEGALIHKIEPVYPFAARQKHVQGIVLLSAVIGKDGRVNELKPVSGPDELIGAAMEAVQQWQYKPYTQNGEPIEVRTTISVNFTLSR